MSIVLFASCLCYDIFKKRTCPSLVLFHPDDDGTDEQMMEPDEQMMHMQNGIQLIIRYFEAF